MIIWNSAKLLEKVDKLKDEVALEGAELVAKTARRLVPDAPPLGEGLVAQIEVRKSKFTDGGYLVVAQGPGYKGKYHASFVELGTYKDEAQPFMRPALNRNKRTIQKRFQSKLNRL